MNSKQMNLTGLCALFLIVSGVHAASPVKLTIEDNASLFSETAREEAKAKLLRLSAAADRQPSDTGPDEPRRATAEIRGPAS